MPRFLACACLINKAKRRKTIRNQYTYVTMSNEAVKLEEALQTYLSKFDGSRREFAKIEPFFKAMFHQKYVLISKGRETTTKEEMKQLHSNHLSRGSYATITKSRKIGKNCIDIQFSINSEADSEATYYRILSRPWRKYSRDQEQNRTRKANLCRDSITLSCARLSVGM